MLFLGLAVLIWYDDNKVYSLRNKGCDYLMKTVILLFHPNMDHSLVNRKLIEAASEKRNVTVRDMYSLYRHHPIDVSKERKVLEEADRIILQFPLRWYDAPFLLQKWSESVFDDYWLHSAKDGGNVLQGKELMLCVAYSEPSYDFTANGKYHYTIKEILRHFEVLAKHLGVKYCEPFTIYELDDIDRASKEYAELIVKEELPVSKD